MQPRHPWCHADELAAIVPASTSVPPVFDEHRLNPVRGGDRHTRRPTVSIAVLSMTHHRLTTQSSLQASMELVELDPCGLLQDQEDGQFACRTCRSGVQWLQPVLVRAGMERTLPE